MKKMKMGVGALVASLLALGGGLIAAIPAAAGSFNVWRGDSRLWVTTVTTGTSPSVTANVAAFAQSGQHFQAVLKYTKNGKSASVYSTRGGVTWFGKSASVARASGTAYYAGYDVYKVS